MTERNISATGHARTRNCAPELTLAAYSNPYDAYGKLTSSPGLKILPVSRWAT
jgi:hypothetical protein